MAAGVAPYCDGTVLPGGLPISPSSTEPIPGLRDPSLVLLRHLQEFRVPHRKEDDECIVLPDFFTYIFFINFFYASI